MSPTKTTSHPKQHRGTKIVLPTKERNPPCFKCLLANPTGGRAFAVCSVCKWASYCSRECQKQDWKAHRDYCAIRRDQNELTVLLNSSVTHSTDQKIAIVRGFMRCHLPVLRQAFTSAVWNLDTTGQLPFNWSDDSFLLELVLHKSQGTDESKINPATKLIVHSCTIVRNMERKYPFMARHNKAVRPIATRKIEMLKFPHFMGLASVLYRFDDQMHTEQIDLYLSPTTIVFESNLWAEYIIYWVKSGFVFHELDDGSVRMGVLENKAVTSNGGAVRDKKEKEKDKWVWKDMDSENPKDMAGRSFPRPFRHY